MKNIFSKRKSETMGERNTRTKGINKSNEQLKRRWANWMNAHTISFTRQRWIVLLFLFIVCVGGVSVCIIINSFRLDESRLILITPIKKPNHILKTGEVNIGIKNLSAKDYSHIKEIRYYMDSLIKSSSGRIIYDSITSLHPGIMDSLHFIENYFQQLK